MKYNEYEEVLQDSTRIQLTAMQDYDWYTGVEYEFDAEALPPCGWRAYYLTAGENIVGEVEKASAALDMCTSGSRILFEKNGKMLYTVHFEDEADEGDSYTFVPGGDRQEMSAEGEAKIECQNGTAILCQKFALQRKDGEVKLSVKVMLDKGSVRPEFDLTVENGAADHRLRMVVTTPQRCTECIVDSPFDLPRRPVFEEATDAMHVRTRPMRNLAAVVGEDTLAVFSGGMRECEATLTEKGTRMALTIIRSVSRAYSTNLPNRDEAACGPGIRWYAPNSRMLGNYSTRCAVAVYAGQADDLTLQKDALSWQLPPSVFGTWTHGENAAEGRFMELDGAVFSTVIAKEHGMIVRVFATKEGGICTLRMNRSVRTAYLTDLRGNKLKDAAEVRINGDTLTVDLKPSQIATMEINFE